MGLQETDNSICQDTYKNNIVSEAVYMGKIKEKKKKLLSGLSKALKGRPMPSAPRAGYKASGSRYGNGGKVSGKKHI